MAGGEVLDQGTFDKSQESAPSVPLADSSASTSVPAPSGEPSSSSAGTLSEEVTSSSGPLPSSVTSGDAYQESSGVSAAPASDAAGAHAEAKASERSSSPHDLAGGEVVFCMENVGIHPSAAASQRIRGRLRLVKQESVVYLYWTPYTPAEHPRGLDPQTRGPQHTIRAVALLEIRSIRRRTPQLGWQYVIFVLNTGLAYPPLYFYDGGVRSFINAMKQHVNLIKSQDEPGVFLVSHSEDPLMGLATMRQQGSFSDYSGSLGSQQSSDIASAAPGRRVGVSGAQSALDAGKDVPLQVLQGFAGITRLARMALGVGRGERQGERTLGGADAQERMPVRAQEQRELRDAGGKKGAAPAMVASDLGQFELVDPLEEVLAATKAPVEDIGPPLSHEEWVTHFDSAGRVVDVPGLKAEVFRRGVDPELRKEVWKFLLGYYAFESTDEERRQLDEQKGKEYRIYKAQWESVTEAQARRFAKYRERVSRIDKDVVRTDRRLPQFESDDSPNLVVLRSVLLSYSFYNFDLGFCQGMSDLLSPFLVITGDETEAFWCFAQFMEGIGKNFNRDQTGMHAQLLSLGKLLRLLDPPLFQYLESVDASNLFFCFRWLLILFKREFEFEDVLKLWERLWTCPMTKHFHLYVCCAILKRFRRKIMDEQMEFDALVRFANELSCRVDLDDILQYAEALCLWAGQRGEACMPLAAADEDVLIEGPETAGED